MRKLLMALAALLVTGPVAAQERVEEAGLPVAVADDVIAFFNDASTIRFNGRSRLPEGRAIVGDVGVLGGPFFVAGLIEGNLIVVNGDLTIEEGGLVDGDVTVIGGLVRTLPEGAVTGTLTVFGEALRYSTRGGEIRARSGPRTERVGIYLGRSRLTVRAGTNYNRVEGLPILFGPALTTSGSNPLELQALAIVRTESESTRDDLGYRIRLEQRIGVPARLTFGGSAYSEVTPIEEWGLTDLETSFATFFLHRDYRDYFERQGFSVFAGARAPIPGLDFRLEYRNEDHLGPSVASPWTLRRREEPWRPLPIVADGELETLTLSAVLDGRNDRDEPTDGWYADARVTRSIGGELVLPGIVGPLIDNGASSSTDFTKGFLDLRRYARIGPGADLTFRTVLAGSLDGGALPAQFQHSLGGEGSLPGYRPFSQDCGARSVSFQRVGGEDSEPGERVFSRYGCDRIALFQVEYRGHLSFDVGLDPDEEDWENWDWYPAVDLTPSWAVFFNAGRGWSRLAAGSDTDTVADLGVGVFLGDLGLYWAYPLTGDDKRVNFFIRLQRRF